MFISLRNLLGLRYERADEERNGPKQKIRSIRSSGRSSPVVPGARRDSRGSLAVVGTSLRNVGAIYARISFARVCDVHA